jgi:hypothetical protein
MSTKRLGILEQMTQAGSRDPFVWYGLAMEYRSLSRNDEAFATFRRLKEIDASYVPMYLMCSQLLADMDKLELARAWIAEGIAIAAGKGDAHAAAELEDAARRLE